MKMYFNNQRQVAQSKHYPNMKDVLTKEDLAEVVAYDHVGATYKDNCRSNANFIQSDCSMFDVDNTHSDDPEKWVTPIELQKAFPGVGFYVCYSRNHMKPKGTKAPRPKFHVYFPDVVFDSAEEYADHKQKVCEYFTAFDPNAKDAARFFFGVEIPVVEFFPGDILLNDFMQTVAVCKQDAGNAYCEGIIPEGERNSAMHRYALSKLTHYGESTDQAYTLFLEEATKCVPPLDNNELRFIWSSALNFYCTKIKNAPNYIAPDEYTKVVAKQKFELPIVDKKSFDLLCKSRKQSSVLSIDALRSLLKSFGIAVRLNDMNHKLEVSGLPKKYNPEDACNLLGTLVADIAVALSFKRVREQVIYGMLNVLANEHHYHPVLELLTAAPWDGEDRLQEVYAMLHLENQLDKVLVHKWALQTIAVLHNTNDTPVSAQGVLVLQGEQGIGKTQFFKHLAINNHYFKEGATLDMTNKDSIMSATKVWMCELGEIDNTTKKEQSSLKAFLTNDTDRFREPYARYETVQLRRTSFCGTVNPKEYLRDETGNRRFWTVHVEKVDLGKMFSYSPEWYTQFWRQMYQEYQSTPNGYLLTKEEHNAVITRNAEYEAPFPGEDEFLTCFDLGADYSEWKLRTASQIADVLNRRFHSLHLRSQAVGKLVGKIGKQNNLNFEKKTIKGTRYILCPPVKEEAYPIRSEDYKISPNPIKHDYEPDSTDVCF